MSFFFRILKVEYCLNRGFCSIEWDLPWLLIKRLELTVQRTVLGIQCTTGKVALNGKAR